MNVEQLRRMREDPGFIAALDQSGGSTPKALSLYGIPESAYHGDAEMFDLVHAMRTRVMTSKAFTKDHILGVILFEMTMDREVEGLPTPRYLWEKKGIVPFLKIDEGLAETKNGVQLMKPMPNLDPLLAKAVKAGIFGTKMRSVIHEADAGGVREIVRQQFEVAERVIASGLCPIIEPEVDIRCPEKARAETFLKEELTKALDGLAKSARVMFKLTIPETDGLYGGLTQDERVVRVVALSGGYTRAVADEKLARNKGMIASFSRALLEGLRADQPDAEFDKTLGESIREIYAASVT